MVDIHDLLALIVVFFCIQYVYKMYFEGFDGKAVENAYSGMTCIRNDLPIVRIQDNKTFECLSIDGTNCLDRSSLQVPNDYVCSDGQKNVNKFLTTDGLRNVRINPTLKISQVFNDFENLRLLNDNDTKLNRNIKLMTCTPEGLQDSNHWCGKVWNHLQTTECSRKDAKFRSYRDVCKKVPEFIGSSTGSGSPVVETNYDTIARVQKAAVQATQSARARTGLLKR